VFGPSETLGELHGEKKDISDSLPEIPAEFAKWLPILPFERLKYNKNNQK